MNPVGIMQGRLSPTTAGRPQQFPWPTWREEFARASACGFAAIEWLVTSERIDDNPIWSDEGVAEIATVCARTSIDVPSLCADYAIADAIANRDAREQDRRLQVFARLIRRAALARIRTVVLPVIENSALPSRAGARAFVAALAPVLEDAQRLGVRVALESDWPGHALAGLVDSADRPLHVCYDLGNAAANGHDPVADIASLSQRICSVHVKDRRPGGPGVQLGHGAVDFAAAFAALAATGYDGPLILETPAGVDPDASARANLDVVMQAMAATRAPR